MKIVFVDANELQAAGMVANNASIQTIRLKKAACQNSMPSLGEQPPSVFFHYRWANEPYLISKPGVLTVDITIEAIISSENLDDSKDAHTFDELRLTSLAHITLQYEIAYSIPMEPVPEEIEKIGGLGAFAKWNSLYACWPYFRQELDHLCSAAMLPRIQLPLIKLMPKAAPTAERASEPQP